MKSYYGQDAGGDFQLQFTKIFASLATNKQINELKSLLAGNLSGLVLDLDMRWLLTNSLVERGALGIADLDAELAKDNSLSGPALTCFRNCSSANCGS
jgi:aminopeptidase N